MMVKIGTLVPRMGGGEHTILPLGVRMEDKECRTAT